MRHLALILSANFYLINYAIDKTISPNWSG